MGLLGPSKLESAYLPGFPLGDMLDLYSEATMVGWAARIVFWCGMVGPAIWLVPLVSSVYSILYPIALLWVPVWRLLRIMLHNGRHKG